MRELFARFHRDESGATALEYGMIVALVSIVIITSLTALGDSFIATFNKVMDSFSALVG